MKKLLVIVTILFTTGIAWAQSSDAKPVPPPEPLPTVTTEVQPQPQRTMNPIARAVAEARRRRQETPQTASMETFPKPKQVQADKPVSSSTSSVVPADDNRNQLVRSLPYQPEKTTPVQASSSVAAKSEVLDSSKLVVCVVNGFEKSGVSAADCAAHGGRVVKTAEVLNSGKNR